MAPLAFDSVHHDLRYAFRNIRTHPGFAIAAISTLALAIGLNTSLFTVFNAVALRPWPVPEPDRVVALYSHGQSGRTGTVRVDEYRQLAANVRSLAGLAAMHRSPVRLDGDDPSRQSTCGFVSGNYFSTLGIPMEAGRGFLPQEDREQAPDAVAVISHATWQTRFGGDRSVLGRTIQIDGSPFTIVGVADRRFTGIIPGEKVDVWAPLSAFVIVNWHDGGTYLGRVTVGGRLAPGATPEQVQAEIDVLDRRFRTEMRLESGGLLVKPTPAVHNPSARAELVPVFALIFAAMVLILMLACANVGNLLLARAAARRSEIAVRLSLGAARSRVVRQLLVESLVLALIAGAAGVALAAWAPPRLVAMLGIRDAGLAMTPDLPVLAFTIVLSLMACLAFGLAPALHATRMSLFETLKDRRAPFLARIPLRSALLAAQVAVSVVLLVSAGLLLRSVQNARSRDLGFPVQNLAGAQVTLPANVYDWTRTRTLYEQIAAEFNGGSRTGKLAVSSLLPLGSGARFMPFSLPDNATAQRGMVLAQEVTAPYFEVLRIPVVAGRSFEKEDAGRQVAMINESMAKRHFGARNPVGRVIQCGSESYEIIGVARDAYVSSIERLDATLYVPFSGKLPGHLLFRSDIPGAGERLSALVARIEPRAKVHVRPLVENLEADLRGSRMASMLAGAMGALALALASIGMFGVFAYAVRQRTREIGTRMALGASQSRVILGVLSSSCRAIAAGLAAGLAGSVVAAWAIESGLYGVARLDPATYAGVLCLVASAALAASVWPARMISKVDPMTALRCE